MYIKLCSQLPGGIYGWKNRALYCHHCHFKESSKGVQSHWRRSCGKYYSQNNEIEWNYSLLQLINFIFSSYLREGGEGSTAI